eukprot:475927_1
MHLAPQYNPFEAIDLVSSVTASLTFMYGLGHGLVKYLDLQRRWYSVYSCIYFARERKDADRSFYLSFHVYLDSLIESDGQLINTGTIDLIVSIGNIAAVVE